MAYDPTADPAIAGRPAGEDYLQMPYDSGTEARGVRIHWGTGSPEAAVTAIIGDAYLQTDAPTGGVGFWIKTSGTGNTGWEQAYSVTAANVWLAMQTIGSTGIGALNPNLKLISKDAGGAHINILELESEVASLAWSSGINFRAVPGMVQIIGQRALGTMASPTALTASQPILEIGGRAYDGVAWERDPNAGIRFETAENQSATNKGARIELWTVSNGATARQQVVTVQDGIQVGTPTGGDKGVGTINCAADIYKNNTAYTTPDYVFEKFYLGHVRDAVAQEYNGLRSLDELAKFLPAELHLPGIKRGASGIFERADMLLEKLEEAHLYILQLHDRLTRVEGLLEEHGII